jgi:DNA-binding MarR family transcriptional regulator
VKVDPGRDRLDKYCLGKYILGIASRLTRTVARNPAPADFYEPEVYRAEDSVGYLMKRVMASIMQQADKRLEAHGLTSAQWSPLLKIKHAGGRANVAELSRWLVMDAGAMTRLLDRLEKKGLCKRVRSTEDRRVVQVELTPDGEAAIAGAPQVLCDVMNAHLAGFSKSEWVALKSYLRRMVETGEAMRDADGEKS